MPPSDALTSIQKYPDRFLTRPTSTITTIRRLYICQPAVIAYLHANQLSLQQPAVLIWSAGLPPRRKEYVQVQWCNGESIRNIYILDGSVVIITGYHKSQWRIGTRPVARFLPPRVGNLLVRYLIYFPSFLRFLYHCMQYAPCRGFLLAHEHGIWRPDRFSNSKGIINQARRAHEAKPLLTWIRTGFLPYFNPLDFSYLNPLIAPQPYRGAHTDFVLQPSSMSAYRIATLAHNETIILIVID